jgi:hypothetical protein
MQKYNIESDIFSTEEVRVRSEAILSIFLAGINLKFMS